MPNESRPLTSEFLYATCQIGAEKALKAEVARARPELRFAYSRPGLITWKHTGERLDASTRVDAVFARAEGLSFGKVDDAAALAQTVAPWRAAEGRPLRLHVFARDVARPGEAPPEHDAAALAGAARTAILAGAPAGTFEVDAAAPPRPRELVVDVIVAAGEPWWLGAHRHGAGDSVHAGGLIPIVLPPEAPSRAYRKLEEALAWSGASPRAGETALEIGSAPGGATYALLRRGVHVIGVDPGAMAPVVFTVPNARFTHMAVPVGALRREQLPQRIDWLLLDVNLAPQVALHTMQRLVGAFRASLRGVLFTLKLNDWGMAAEVPALLERVRGMGLSDVRATQLPSNRQEIFVYGRGGKVR